MNFISDFNSNLLIPVTKSQEVPSENNDLIKVLVGKNIEEKIINSTSDAIVIFHPTHDPKTSKFLKVMNEVSKVI